MHLNAPIIAMAPTRDRPRATGCSAPTAACSRSATRTFFGSTGAMKLNAPVVGMGAAAGGQRLLARSRADGGMFSFGDATLLRLAARHWAGAPAPASAVAFTGTDTGAATGSCSPTAASSPFGDAEHFGDAPASARPVAFAVKP